MQYGLTFQREKLSRTKYKTNIIMPNGKIIYSSAKKKVNIPQLGTINISCLDKLNQNSQIIRSDGGIYPELVDTFYVDSQGRIKIKPCRDCIQLNDNTVKGLVELLSKQTNFIILGKLNLHQSSVPNQFAELLALDFFYLNGLSDVEKREIYPYFEEAWQLNK